MEKERLVLVGNGMAGIRMIEELLQINPDKYEITVFGSEPYPNYNRIQLSNVLQGEAQIEDLILNSLEWYEARDIHLNTGETVVSVDPEQQTIKTDKGQEVVYNKLVLATGSLPFILPLPGADLEGVTAFRNIEDTKRLLEDAKRYKRATVIGGGLLGLEAARGLLNLGMTVDVVHLADHLMEMQLDIPAAKMLMEELEHQGIAFHLEKQTTEIIGANRVEGLRFADGEILETDLVVMSVGIKPNVGLARKAGIPVHRGIVVNDFMETEIPNIYALGECAEHHGLVYGLVAPLYQQGKVLAARLCGVDHEEGYHGSVVSTHLKISGVDVFSTGEIHETADTKTIRVFNDLKGIYQKILVKEGKIQGAVLYGDTHDGDRLFSLINKGASIDEYTNENTSAKTGVELVASLSDDEIICGCNGVTKGTIVNAIKTQGLTTIEEVKLCTNASRSCGLCRPKVADLLELTLGSDFKNEVKETICGCTDLSRDEVVAAIKEKGLTHTKEVMQVLGWKTEEGCSKCRPALNYYLGMLNPLDYQDEKASRYVNERLHANIQKDGTFSVVPRMYGGVTTVEELRKIADVAEKYQVPLIKMTGGQRIDLIGVQKEDLPNVWQELGMPSGSAYAKGLRTVKTCVGERFCRFGTQDSIGMGIQMEKTFEGLNTPHKIKMSVSACPRNCSEGGVKDVGVIGLDGAWEIYVGGNGGTHLRKADLLCKVKTREDVLEFIGAFLQYYRENAKYLERTSAWVERVGLESIQKVLDDEGQRKELNTRLEEALSVIREPWQALLENDQERQALYQTVKVPPVLS